MIRPQKKDTEHLTLNADDGNSGQDCPVTDSPDFFCVPAQIR